MRAVVAAHRQFHGNGARVMAELMIGVPGGEKPSTWPAQVFTILTRNDAALGTITVLGASAVQGQALGGDDWGIDGSIFLPAYEDTAEKFLRMAKDLIRHKARWTPDAYDIRGTRRAVCQISPQCVSDLVGLLGRPGVCSPAVLQKLVGSPAMQDLLKRAGWRP